VLTAVTACLEQEHIEVVGTACTGDETVALLEERRPTVALVNLHMPGLAGAELVRAACRAAPQTALLVYTGYATRAAVYEGLDAGARGVIFKGTPLPEVVRAVRIVASGGEYLDPVLGAAVIADWAKPETLTARERDVLRLLAEGLSNDEIGGRLHISGATVRSHVRKAMAKLGARTRVEAVAKALRQAHIA